MYHLAPPLPNLVPKDISKQTCNTSSAQVAFECPVVLPYPATQRAYRKLTRALRFRKPKSQNTLIEMCVTENYSMFYPYPAQSKLNKNSKQARKPTKSHPPCLAQSFTIFGLMITSFRLSGLPRLRKKMRMAERPFSP